MLIGDPSFNALSILSLIFKFLNTDNIIIQYNSYNNKYILQFHFII